MCHLIAALLLFVAFANCSWGETVDTGKTDANSGAGAKGDISKENTVSKEAFLQKMGNSEPYWAMKRSYEDITISNQKKVCISTERTQQTKGNEDVIFLQKYKLEGCEWFTTTHDARYNVTFTDTPGVGAGLSITMTPIDYTDILQEKTYSVLFWNPDEGCFVFKLQTSEGADKCELLAWDKEASVGAQYQSCEASYKTCSHTEGHQLFSESCRTNHTIMMQRMKENPELIATCM
uniref:Lipocalin/cytosolic fatty-acid binding domain-containing protein n=1 Tax=Amblyomma maculatum TaxID=34609 RepID=G3MKN4_AMBMU